MASALELLIDSPKKAKRTIVLAHGAGASMDTPIMDFFAKTLADRGFRVARFDFPTWRHLVMMPIGTGLRSYFEP